MSVAISLSLSAGVAQQATAPAAASPRVVCSLDKRQSDREIIVLINSAKTPFAFAMYVFTLPDIADALVAAKERGVEVRGFLDAEESAKGYEARIVAELRRAGISIEVERHADGRGIMRIKTMVTESAYAVGSYNWTHSATAENDEILEISTDPATVAAYESILRRLLDRYARNRARPQRGAASCIPFTEAPAHILERACVRGKLFDAHRSGRGTVFLDFLRTADDASAPGADRRNRHRDSDVAAVR